MQLIKHHYFTITYLVMSDFRRASLADVLVKRRALLTAGETGRHGLVLLFAGAAEGHEDRRGNAGAQAVSARTAPAWVPLFGPGEAKANFNRKQRGGTHARLPPPCSWMAASPGPGTRALTARGGKLPWPTCSGHAWRSNLEVSIRLTLASFCSFRKEYLGLII